MFCQQQSVHFLSSLNPAIEPLSSAFRCSDFLFKQAISNLHQTSSQRFLKKRCSSHCLIWRASHPSWQLRFGNRGYAAPSKCSFSLNSNWGLIQENPPNFPYYHLNYGSAHVLNPDGANRNWSSPKRMKILLRRSCRKT